MAARWVPAAVVRPHRCAFIPFVGGREPRGFFDFGTSMTAIDGHVYCSWTAFEEMVRLAGYGPVGGKSQADSDLERARGELKDRDARISVLEAQVAAVEVLKGAGFTPARKPGRPKKAVPA